MPSATASLPSAFLIHVYMVTAGDRMTPIPPEKYYYENINQLQMLKMSGKLSYISAPNGNGLPNGNRQHLYTDCIEFRRLLYQI